MTFKPLIAASVLGVISAVASTAAFATDTSSTFCKPGFYAGIQGGRSDTFYSGKSLVPVAAPTHSEGVIQSGRVFTKKFSIDTSEANNQKTDDIGMGGRIYAGYQFNPYFALETGYTQYAKTTFGVNSSKTKINDTITVTNNNGIQTIAEKDTEIWNRKYNGEITENAIDLVGKATLPLDYGFGLYVKGGAAYISANRHTSSKEISYTKTHNDYVNDTSSKETINFNNQNSGVEFTKSYQAFRPVAGVGVNYAIPHSNISLDASYSRVFSSGAIPQASLLALGAEYKFN